MKKATPFSYKNHAVISALESSSLSEIRFDTWDKDYAQIREYIEGVWEQHSGDFRQDIRYITKPLLESFDLAKKRILEMPNCLQDWYGKYGVILTTNYSICYYINGTPDNPSAKMDTVLFVFLADILVGFGKSSTDNMPCIAWFSEEFKATHSKNFPHMESTQDYYDIFSTEPALMLSFLNYIPLEIKQLPAGQMVKLVDCKYRNDTKSNITIVNSTWFTTLVKSDAFKVRGHFRLQPYGEGHKDRKLMWINDFQKSGYTAPARKIQAV